MKLEEKFGFGKKRIENSMKNYPKEEKYFPPRYDEKKWDTTESFIKDMLSCCHRNLYCDMGPIFGLFIAISKFLIVVVFLISILHFIGLL